MNANPARVSERVIGCAMTVSKVLGAGFLESVYSAALALEFAEQGLDFQSKQPLTISYRGRIVGSYCADFVVEGRLIVEVKALSALAPSHEAQMMNYLRASKTTVGLLLNFGTPKLGIKRIVQAHDDNHAI